MEQKRPLKAKTILRKNKPRGIPLPGFKVHYKVVGIKILWKKMVIIKWRQATRMYYTIWGI